jgi:hypothetical protein
MSAWRGVLPLCLRAHSVSAVVQPASRIPVAMLTASQRHCVRNAASFVDLFASTDFARQTRGSKVIGTVLSADNKSVTVDIGAKFPAVLKRTMAGLSG